MLHSVAKYNSRKKTFIKIYEKEKIKGHKMVIGWKNIEESIDDTFSVMRNDGINPRTENYLVDNEQIALSLMYYGKVHSSRISLLSDEDNFSKMVAKWLNICYYNINDVAKNYKINNRVRSNMRKIATDKKWNTMYNPQFDEPLSDGKQTRTIWTFKSQIAMELTGDKKFNVPFVPDVWLNSGDEKFVKMRNIFLSHNVIKHKTGIQKKFPSEPGINIGRTIIQKGVPYQGKTEVVDTNLDKTIKNVNLNNGYYTPFRQEAMSLCTKILKSSDQKYILQHVDAGKLYKNVPKLILNYSTSYYSVRNDENSMPFTTDVCDKPLLQRFMLVKDKQQADMERSFLHSKPMRYAAKYYKRWTGPSVVGGYTQLVKEYSNKSKLESELPYFETKMWTDEEVYKVMKLTKAEIKKIETDLE